MPENVHDQAGTPPPVALPPVSAHSDYVEIIDEEEDEKARLELARISPTKEELEKFVAQCGPLPKWLDEDEPPPF
jgi:hypothetical protein